MHGKSGAFPKVILNLLCVLSSPLIMLLGEHSDFLGKARNLCELTFPALNTLKKKKEEKAL